MCRLIFIIKLIKYNDWSFLSLEWTPRRIERETRHRWRTQRQTRKGKALPCSMDVTRTWKLWRHERDYISLTNCDDPCRQRTYQWMSSPWWIRGHYSPVFQLCTSASSVVRLSCDRNDFFLIAQQTRHNRRLTISTSHVTFIHSCLYVDVLFLYSTAFIFFLSSPSCLSSFLPSFLPSFFLYFFLSKYLDTSGCCSTVLSSQNRPYHACHGRFMSLSGTAGENRQNL